MNNDFMLLKNKKGLLLFLPRRSPYELERHRERKHASMKVFAAACLLLAFGVAMALYANVVYGRF